MKAKLALLVIICISSLTLAVAIETIEVLETDFVNLQVTVKDPDNDQLSVFYTPPLDEQGQWQTTYGDAGLYNLSIRVSDGQLTTAKEVLLFVIKKNEAPEIVATSPQQEVSINEGQSLVFTIEGTDINQDPVQYSWAQNERKLESTTSSIEFFADYGDAGNHEITANVNDGEKEVSYTWEITVNKVDREKLLDGFQDITIAETESVKITLPDFAAFNLEHKISAPLDKGRWKTTYDDAGEYDIVISIKDRDFEAEKTITVTVLDNDRLPVVDRIGTIFINENEQVSFDIITSDPDGDGVDITLTNLPEGASFSSGTFTWQTNFDTVQKDTLVEKIADKFHLLYYPYKLEFVAKSNELTATETIYLWVKDVNRAPELTNLETIQVVEGDPVTITPAATDPDGDKITFTYAGWMTSDSRSTNFDDAGKHIVKVTASDGFLKETKEVVVEVTNKNRLPTATVPSALKVKENEEITFSIETADPDNDPTTVRIIDTPRGMKIQDKTITWKPGYDVSSEGISNITISAVVSDGNDEIAIGIPILVEHVNRAPVIKTTQPKSGSKGIAGRPVTFVVDAIDPDGDALTYTWEFGLFDKYNGTAAMRRTFTTAGKKKVTVKVDDGLEQVEETWEIDILKIVQQQPVQQVQKKPAPQPTQPATQQQDPKVFHQYAVIG